MYERALLYSFHFHSCLKFLYFFLLKLNPLFTHHSLSFIPLFFFFSIPHAIDTYYSRHPETFAGVCACESEGNLNLKERQIKMKTNPPRYSIRPFYTVVCSAVVGKVLATSL
jgi:hypothetical protein